MRKVLLAVVAVALLLAGLLLARSRGRPVAEGAGSARLEPTRSAGTRLQPELPADLGARGDAAPGSTPSLAQAPAVEDGALEVSVAAGPRPVAGASVRLYWRGPADPSTGEVAWRLASAGSTDAAGQVSLPSRPGAYRLAVRAAGLAPAQRDVVRPYGEARTRARVALEPGQPLVGRTVVKGSGEALPQVELVLTAHGRTLESWEAAHAPAEERVYGASDARGHFRLEGLAPGEYALEARAPGHARVVQRRVQVPAAEALTLALPLASVLEGYVVDAQGRGVADAQVQVVGREPQLTTTGEGGGFSVEVEAGPHRLSARKGSQAGALPRAVVVAAGATVRDVRLVLAPGGVLEGRVVAKAGGAPVADASVDVSPAGLSGDSGRARTGADGAFRVEGLAPGSYDVGVSAPGFAAADRRGLTVAAGERFPLEVALTGTGAVQGAVRDGAGRPVAGARVVGGSRWGAALGTQPAEAVTDAAGRYALTGLEAGEAYLTARREGATLGTGQPVAVREGETAQADFTLEEVGFVEGRVRTPEGRVPEEPLGVRAFPQGLTRLYGADLGRAPVQEGRFALTLPAGRYGLRVATGGASLGSFETRPVTVEAGRTAQVELTYAPDAERLSGVVLEPEGVPSSGAGLLLSAESGSMRMGFYADEDGRFSVSLRSGTDGAARYTLAATNGGRSGSVQGLRAGGGEVVVQLKPGASVRGRVVRAGGAPVQGFRIRVEARGPVPFGGGTQAFPGERFELPGVPGEPLVLVATTEDRAEGRAEVQLSPGASAEVTVTLRATGSISGRVVDAAGLPLAGAQVTMNTTGYDETGPDGLFTLAWIRAGEHTVRVRAPGGATLARTVSVAEGQALQLGDLPVRAAALPDAGPGGLAQEGR